MPRDFETAEAKREATPVAVGIIGPSGSGKTKSALRLADGMARVNGGETWVIDTNNRRSLHHAADHRFRVLHLPPPHSPADYGEAFAAAIKGGAKRIIVDSMSDEWEGEGGVLDLHDRELDRRAGDDDAARERKNMSAWIGPKREHNRLRIWMFNQPVDWILTFRAKAKIKPVKGKQPEDQGWQPLGAEDLIYELLLKCLLRPQADGRPTWTSEILHERALMKLPGWFRDLFRDQPQLNEDIGERLARWAAGGDLDAPRSPSLAERLAACADTATYERLDAEMRATWDKMTAAERAAVKQAHQAARARRTKE